MTAMELKRMPQAVHEAVRPAERAAERPDTPCVAVCSTTFDDICRGCGRTYIEVAHWVSMTAEQKEAVWERITAQGYPRRNS